MAQQDDLGTTGSLSSAVGNPAYPLPMPRRRPDLGRDVITSKGFAQKDFFRRGHQANAQQEKLIERHQKENTANQQVPLQVHAKVADREDLDDLEHQIT